MKNSICALVLATVILFAGCSGIQDITGIEVVKALGIGRVEQGYIVSAAVVSFSEDSDEYRTLSAKGNTLREAFGVLNGLTNKELFYGLNSAVIVETALAGDLLEIIEYLTEDGGTFSPDSPLYVCEGASPQLISELVSCANEGGEIFSISKTGIDSEKQLYSISVNNGAVEDYFPIIAVDADNRAIRIDGLYFLAAERHMPVYNANIVEAVFILDNRADRAQLDFEGEGGYFCLIEPRVSYEVTATSVDIHLSASLEPGEIENQEAAQRAKGLLREAYEFCCAEMGADYFGFYKKLSRQSLKLAQSAAKCDSIKSVEITIRSTIK